MKRQNYNQGWSLAIGAVAPFAALLGGAANETNPVQLPHDAMIYETPDPNDISGAQTGFYPGGEYVYTKKEVFPEDLEGKDIFLEFEGVYDIAQIYVNDAHVTTNLYGYSTFYANIKDYIRYGEENEIRVLANNPTPNSRWYSGSGIYRPVNLYIGNDVHIEMNGVKATTLKAEKESAIVNVETKLVNLTRKKQPVQVSLSLSKDGKVVKTDLVTLKLWAEDHETVRQNIRIAQPELWSIDTPSLYDLSVQILQGEEVLDEYACRIGLRTLTLDADNGLCINGESVNLKGTCIHHDNGVIGAATYADAERRRARQMKEAGFNSIRSAHHPMSRAMLEACDEYGITVMDELADMWYVHKNRNDFAAFFEKCWKEEVERIVAKDYNHPCVIMYSSGNEIMDLGNQAGGRMNRQVCNLFHELDATRYTTTAVNGLIAAGISGVMPEILSDIAKKRGLDLTAMTTSEETGQDGPMGDMGAMNMMMSLMDDDDFARHPKMTEAVEEAAQSEDIAGFNYMTSRHELEKELHPNKPIVGTETYPADIVRLWRIVEDNAHVLGDYTWTGYDYLGEAGCGIFYYDGTVNFSSHFPDRIAYIGDIDIIGNRRPISYLREVVYGDRKAPYLAVTRLNRYGIPITKTSWMYKDDIASWTWPGYEGKPTEAEIFSVDEEVELFVNGKSYGRKPAGRANGFIATYDNVIYEPGDITAVSYRDGAESGRMVLKTAGEAAVMKLTADASAIKADPESLAYVTVSLTDAEGVENFWAKKSVTVSVEGPAVLQGYGSADPQPTRAYQDTTWETYDGKVMAVIRSTGEAGKITATFSAEGMEPAVMEILAE